MSTAIVLRPDATATVADLAAHASAHLAKFEVPSRWWLRAAALPTNATGKIVKRDVIESWPTG